MPKEGKERQQLTDRWMLGLVCAFFLRLSCRCKDLIVCRSDCRNTMSSLSKLFVWVFVGSEVVSTLAKTARGLVKE